MEELKGRFTKSLGRLFDWLQIRIGGQIYSLGPVYRRIWNPLNYLIIGGIGVLVNYLVQAILLGFMPWYISNGLAIFLAWSWNWSQSVGPYGHLWGFSERDSKK